MTSHAAGKSLPLALLAILVLLLSSCLKNEFNLKGHIEGGEAATIYLSWRAASGTRDFLATQAVPLTGSDFQVRGPVKRPAVIWIFSSGRRYLSAIYVERGNDLHLSGQLNRPELWQVSGNKVMDKVSQWRKDNEATVQGGTPAALNAAVATFVKQNKYDRAALFLLLTVYDRSVDSAGYAKLLKGFTDTSMLTEMQQACLEPMDGASVTLPAARAKRIEQVLNDTTDRNKASIKD